MRVAFVCDIVATQRGGVTIRQPITSFLRPSPTVELSPPSDTGPQLYAGVAELSGAQVTALRAAAVTKGVRLALFSNFTGNEDSALAASEPDSAVLDQMLADDGLAPIGGSETRGAVLSRIFRDRNVNLSLDRVTTRLAR